ncbi:MAG: GMP reductase [Candidatus Dojkabacteria bacterium]|nr:GMP reductase [Candidatus Dojkabacteria bacterium]
MRIEYERKIDFSDVLIKPKRSTLSSRKEVDIYREFVFPHSNIKYFGVPILASNMDTIGTIEMANSLEKEGCGVVLHKFHDNDVLYDFLKSKYDQGIFYHWVCTGITNDNFEKIKELNSRINLKYVCLDVANGYQETFVKAVQKFRDLLKDSVIMAGNVVTGDMTEALILAGADVVKVGIGSGKCCTTRKMTGVGYPQLSAVIECSDAAHGLRGLICSDGGIREPSDLVKAFCAGADFCMIGSSFGGHDECGGQIIERDGKKYMQIYGMSSEIAQIKYYGEKPKYRASEGICLEVEYKGKVLDTLREYLGGLRSAMTYIGARKLKEMSKRATFIVIT